MKHFLFQEILGKKFKVPSLQNYIIHKNLATVFANSKYQQKIRIAEIIQQISILLVLNVSLGFIFETLAHIRPPKGYSPPPPK
jgi:hypothetical protein